MHSPTTATATQLLAAISAREISCVEALEAHLAQVRAENPRLNAVVTLDEEGARARAREADEALARGEVWGPLHGLPMTLKDGHSTAGMRTTAGYEPLRDYVPAEDGTVAARLRSAGAVIFGKTNVSVLLGDIQSDNAIFGRTNNPWDPERTSGGSSGGAAAALASGMTPLEVGSDFAGSIRIPAAFCGVCGLKATEHRVSMWGHIPDVPGTPRSHRLMWSLGPIARSVEDLALAYRLLAGPDGKDVDVPPVPIWRGEGLPKRPLRLAVATTFPGVPVQGAIREAILALANRLQQAGAHVELRLPQVDFLELARARVAVSRAARVTFRDDLDEETPTVADLMRSLDVRDRITRQCEAFFGEWDALVCPVAMTTAFPHRPTETPIEVDGEQVGYWRVIGHCAPFNFTGHPSLALPVDLDSQGLPVGVQIVGKRWGEEGLLAVGAWVDSLTGWRERRMEWSSSR